MKSFILTICMFFTTFSYLQGQGDTIIYGKAPNERKIISPSIPGDKPGETEEFRRFLNKNLDLSLVANKNLKKGYVIIDCKLDTFGKAYYFMEGTGEDLYDYRTTIAKEFMRVLNLIPQWNPTLFYKDGSWKKIRSFFSIYISIPYNTEKSIPKPKEWDDIMFIGIRQL